MMPKTIWVTMLWVLLLAGCDSHSAPLREWRPEDHGQPQQDDTARSPEPAEPEQGGVERAADALFNVSCASCHGRDGRGQGAGRPPGAELPDFTSPQFQKQRSDAELLSVIQHGRGMMPPFAKQINEQGMAALVGRVRRFGAAGQ